MYIIIDWQAAENHEFSKKKDVIECLQNLCEDSCMDSDGAQDYLDEIVIMNVTKNKLTHLHFEVISSGWKIEEKEYPVRSYR